MHADGAIAVRFVLLSALLIAAGFFSQSARAEGTALSLLNTVEVSSETITLSDLLPAAASESLRNAGYSILLGRSPQPGSIRVLTASDLRDRIPQSFRSGDPGMVVPAAVLVRRTCPVLDRAGISQRIFHFLHEQEWLTSTSSGKEDILWPRELCNSGDSLQPVRARWDGLQGLVQITLRPQGIRPANDVLLAVKLPATRFERAAIPQLAQSREVSRKPAALLVRNGERATLVLDSGPVHLSAPIICLQAGRMHQVIRVRAVGSPTVSQAEVIAQGKLRPRTSFGEK
ncbi:MAG TPA: hypothetical protein VFA68_01310 [Terriglobales bacterium]|nr:hypothetical protein [Terriglobales bacterium]